jgi:hypothetical protein
MFACVVLQVQLTESCSDNQTPSQTNQADWLTQGDKPIALNLHAQGLGSGWPGSDDQPGLSHRRNQSHPR